MRGLYKSENDRIKDVIIANSKKVNTLVKDKNQNSILIPSTEYEKILHMQDCAEAIVRLAIDRAMNMSSN